MKRRSEFKVQFNNDQEIISSLDKETRRHNIISR